MLANQHTHALELSYFCDEKDGISVALNQDNSFDEGATGYVYKLGRTTCFTKQQMQAAADNGLFRALGSPAEHWVGVPIYQEKILLVYSQHKATIDIRAIAASKYTY
ncbi:hypothetical protein ACOBV8_07015 [Pseudoalteromonas espejiana]